MRPIQFGVHSSRAGPFFIVRTRSPLRSINSGRMLMARRRFNNSVTHTPGFPPADIAQCGPALVVYGHDKAAAEAAADRLADAIRAKEAAFAGKLWSPDEAALEAIRLSKGAKLTPPARVVTQARTPAPSPSRLTQATVAWVPSPSARRSTAHRLPLMP